MSFTFTPLTDEQIEAISMVEPGEYDFTVLYSQRKISRAGNPMCQLQLQIWDREGCSRLINDYLVFSSVPLNIKKVSHFCKSVGLDEQYDKGNIQEDLSGLNGKCVIGIDEEEPNPNGGFYPKKNSVRDYLKCIKKEEKQAVIDEKFNDDVPF